MIIADSALEKSEREGRPVRVGIIGSGYMGRAVALSLLMPVKGMRLAAIYSRDLARAERAYATGGTRDPQVVVSSAELDHAIARETPAITDDPYVVCEAARIDVIVEATGDVEFGAEVTLRAIAHRKHVVLMNAQLNATLGPILKVYADRNAVVITDIDGDEPGVAMNLIRFARMAGYQPVAAGNIKGMLDHYRTPDTQQVSAEQHGQTAKAVTSYADGTKLSMETTVLANAAGFGVAKRGMLGPRCDHVTDLLRLLPPEAMLSGGIVDYCVGAAPHSGAWVIAHNDHPVKQEYMKYFKMGDGPFYLFYTPYHLPHVQILATIARAALFHDATVAPMGGPRCEVLTLAKRDLKRGDVLDGIGGYMTYGSIDSAVVQREEHLLPMGLSEGCVLERDVPRDSAVGYADVRLPTGRASDKLRAEQDERFAPTPVDRASASA